jgi:hypothetical protein
MNTQTSVTATSLVAMAEQNPMGFTIDTNGNEVSGAFYVIGVEMTKDSHNLEGAEHCIESYEILSESDVVTQEVIKGGIKLGFGGWLDTETNTYHFDVVMLMSKETCSLTRARVMGRMNKQISIFDLEVMQEIRL